MKARKAEGFLFRFQESVNWSGKYDDLRSSASLLNVYVEYLLYGCRRRSSHRSLSMTARAIRDKTLLAKAGFIAEAKLGP